VRIDVLNGVNLDLLGRRDPAQYGDGSLQDLETQVYAWARELGLQVRCRQTNHEGEYVEFLHAALDNADALVLNTYRSPDGKRYHHKIYGYLRTPEFSQLVSNFI